MKTAAGLLTPSAALARVFITSTGPRQTGLLASYSYASSNVHSYSTTTRTTERIGNGSSTLSSSGRLRQSIVSQQQQQRRCFGKNNNRGPPRARPGSGPPRRHFPPKPHLGGQNGPPNQKHGGSGPRGRASGAPEPEKPLTTENFFGEGPVVEDPVAVEPVVINSNPNKAGPKKRQNQAAPRVKFTMARNPRNREIEYSHVIIRHEDGRLDVPVPIESVLSQLDLRRYSLVAVRLPGDKADRVEGKGSKERNEDEEGDESEEGRDAEEAAEAVEEPILDPVASAKKRAAEEVRLQAIAAMERFPVCRIVDTKKEREAENERKRLQRKKNIEFKELEMNWAIDAHNLSFRMKKLTEFLSKGYVVEIRMMRKSASKGKKQATLQEAEQLVAKIRETVAETPGCEYYKAQEGALLHPMKIHVRGPQKK